MTIRDKKLVDFLEKEWLLLKQSNETLELSFRKCKAIGIKDQYSFEEQESFDSLTSKFSRTSDILIQKVLRTVWSLMHEPAVPFIDLANGCEKSAIISSADELIEIRDLRNRIAHEYIPEVLRDMLPEIFEETQILIVIISLTETFLLGRGWIHPELG
jgi:hypothetical protein